ncbi:MAG: hypothetical protein ACYCZQ_03230 [Burkholderiales bacterium]
MKTNKAPVTKPAAAPAPAADESILADDTSNPGVDTNPVDDVTSTSEPVTTGQSVDTSASTTQGEGDASEPTDAKPDFSWVPKKYLKNGEPDFQALANAYTSLEKKLGKKGAMAPESIDDYVYEPSVLEDGTPKVTLDPASTKAFQEEAQKAGLSVDQYKWMMAKYEDVIEGLAQTPEKTKAALQKDWGKDFDTNLQYAKKAFDEFAPGDIDVDDVGNNPAVIKLLANIGMQLDEAGTPAPAKKAPTTTIEDIRAIMKEPDYRTNKAKQKQVAKWFEENATDPNA